MLIKEQDKIRVRIAPSPTGLLHIGTARAALFNYLFAKKYGSSTSSGQAQFILRIEDTDLERSDKKYEQDIIDGLRWLGIEWDEGPKSSQKFDDNKSEYVGNHGPYRQTERIENYRKYLQILLDKNLVYYCPCSEEALGQERQEQLAQKQPLKHLCPYCDGSAKEGIIRFRTPENKLIKFNDLIRGEVKFESNLIGDFSVAKAINIPLYNFAVVIDDYEMTISHVIRGEDHLSNTPKQILLQQALGLPTPQYGHLPLILGTDKSKLSKRHGTISVNDYREQGYLPGAMVNFIAFLGWNPGTEEEIFSLSDLEKIFSLERVGKSGAVFNIERLNWLNGYYIRQTSLEKLTEMCIPYLERDDLIEVQGSRFKVQGNNLKFKIVETEEIVDVDYLQQIIVLEQERLKVISEISEKTRYFFVDKLIYDRKLLKWKNMTDDELRDVLQKLQNIISQININDFNLDNLKDVLLTEANKMVDRGKLLWPLRVALSGLKASPDPFSIMAVLGKEKVITRIEQAIEVLS